jgi:hypothetical protein
MIVRELSTSSLPPLTPRSRTGERTEAIPRCVLCCSAFTVAMVVWRLMGLRMMAIVGTAITAERFAPRPHIATRIGGVVLICAGVFLLVRKFVMN